MSASPLEERVHVLRIWATARIEECSRKERVLTSLTAITEAHTERRALQAVLALLENDVESRVTEAGP